MFFFHGLVCAMIQNAVHGQEIEKLLLYLVHNPVRVGVLLKVCSSNNTLVSFLFCRLQ